MILCFFFLLVVVLFYFLPSFVYESLLPPTIFNLQQGEECMDLSRDLKLAQQQDLIQACPMYNPIKEAPMIQVSEMWRERNATLPEPVSFDSLLRLVSTINSVKSLIPVITTGRNSENFLPKWTALSPQSKVFFSSDCVDILSSRAALFSLHHAATPAARVAMLDACKSFFFFFFLTV